ncbi:MAG: peptidoglycan-associated lipoprotein Pal [Pseudomonadota bacterium]|nr:peptidoglycan-associated lipoprotein Pal [Pseudomonadota bacterium]MEE3100033.1 peptidoglycan-associated lipoprotein Pal [Pseudomonadota bacterium]
MTLIRPLAFGLMALGLAACSTNTPDTTTAAPTTPSLDPSSVAYFNSQVGDRVFFGTDMSTLDVEAQSTLRRQAEWLIANPTRTAVIEGHADERGTREYNLALGARRASAVRNFLVAEGVPAGRLSSVTYGKERPEALCSAESCWSLNRRGVTVMADGPTS